MYPQVFPGLKPIASLTRISVERLIALRKVVSFEPLEMKTAHLVMAPVLMAYIIRVCTKESDLAIEMRNVS